jgi:EAL domain-containing protein (putative c-di-GMP-specific phosphodiesterase class I)/GGDEF domain-containing protein
LDFHINPPLVQLDPVTGLPNRQKFIEDFRPIRHNFASLIMITLADAKHFNEILRALGHDWSDEFICEGAARVSHVLPPGTIVYHVSILSFAFIVTTPPEPLIARLLTAFSDPIYCQDIPVVPRIGIGVANCRDLQPSDILRAGLVAAQDSRRLPERWASYDHSSDNAHRQGFVILSQLSAALSSGSQLSLNFQPKIEMATGRVAGAEALLRWTHPSLGVISPAEFVRLAEATDHVHKLTEWVLESALAQAAIWDRQGLDLTLAINISPHNLSQRGFAAQFMERVRRHWVKPSSIELEFTEGVLATNNEIVVAELRELRGHGVNIALDDFGTGFSNLGYISRLPANIIKIDRSLIRPIGADRRAAAVVQALIDLAHKLDYRVVAEGIETESIYNLVKQWNCNEAQGYFISRPLDAQAFANFIATRGIRPAQALPAAIETEHAIAR